MKEKLMKLKDQVILKHARFTSGGFKRDDGAITVEVVVWILIGLMIATFVGFSILGMTKDDVMPGIKANFKSLFDNITTGS
ncbi:hypothetical protein [Acetobacterium woodii]|uniref:hypothetical protein n=1 Tax=Acetobacterium woodii TaxID=33952 RepID=UPI00031B3344|nr:hypothetical protein [Acetobacterium woodii]